MDIKDCFKYTPVISKVNDEVDGDLYIGRYLEFPEALTNGKTFEELEKNMEEVLELTIQCRLRNEDLIPEPFEMKDFNRKYPISLKDTKDSFYVYVPGWDIHTQGDNLEDVIEMAKDAIGLMWMGYEEEGMEIPKPKLDFNLEDFDIKTFAGINIEKYKNDYETGFKNCI